jgi:hypothetical protein
LGGYESDANQLSYPDFLGGEDNTLDKNDNAKIE